MLDEKQSKIIWIGELSFASPPIAKKKPFILPSNNLPTKWSVHPPHNKYSCVFNWGVFPLGQCLWTARWCCSDEIGANLQNYGLSIERLSCWKFPLSFFLQRIRFWWHSLIHFIFFKNMVHRNSKRLLEACLQDDGREKLKQCRGGRAR